MSEESFESIGIPANQPQPENVVRRLYRWVLHWADTPYGTPALAAISFAESSFFPIPPDVLQIALSAGKPKSSFYYAAVSTVASVAGGVLGYYIGFALWSVVSDWFFSYVPGFSQEVFERVRLKYEQNAFLALFGAAFTPIPYKVFTIAGGVFEIPLLTLVWASVLGRGARFFLVATIFYFFGERAKTLLDKYFEIITIGLFILLIAGFVIVKYIT